MCLILAFGAADVGGRSAFRVPLIGAFHSGPIQRYTRPYHVFNQFGIKVGGYPLLA